MVDPFVNEYVDEDDLDDDFEDEDVNDSSFSVGPPVTNEELYEETSSPHPDVRTYEDVDDENEDYDKYIDQSEDEAFPVE